MTVEPGVTSANVRQQPDATSAVISRAAQGTFFEVIKKTGNWYEVAVTDATGRTVTGFINADVVEEVGGGGGAAAAPAPSRGGAPAYAAPKAAAGGSAGRFSVMLGPVLSNIALSEDLGDTKKSPRFGLAAGASYEIPIAPNMYAGAGLFFTTGGANFTFETVKWSYVGNALGIPITVRYAFNGPFILAGPCFGIVMSPKMKWEGDGQSGEETIDSADMNTFQFGVLVGVGYETQLSGMTAFVQLVYNLGLSKFNKTGTGTAKPNAINIIGGIRL